MATIDGNGSWVPEDSIAQKRRTASDFWQTPQGGYGSGWGGGLAAALSGLGYGMNLTAADSDSRSNQALRSSTMAQAAGAKDNMSMGKILLGAGIPGLDEKGMGTIADARNTADSRSFTEKQAAASRAHSERMLSLQGVQQLSNARAMVPIELDKESRLAQQKSDRDVAAIGGAADTLRTKLPPEVYDKALAAAKAGNRQEALDIILGKDKAKDTFDLKQGETRYQQVRGPDGKITAVPIVGGADPNLGPYKDMKQRADVEEGLRKELATAAKEYNTIKDASTSLDAISKAPSAAKDIAMVFSFMKILDPNSVVRETEYATAAKAAGLDDRFVGYITKIQNGQFLTPEQRQDFLGTAKTLAASREQGYRQSLERYNGISQRLSVDPRNVLPESIQPPTAQPQTRQTAPARPRAQNPQTGQTIEWDGSQWVEVK